MALAKNVFWLTTAGCACLQADSDHHVKDTYNYVTVQADIR